MKEFSEKFSLKHIQHHKTDHLTLASSASQQT